MSTRDSHQEDIMTETIDNRCAVHGIEKCGVCFAPGPWPSDEKPSMEIRIVKFERGLIESTMVQARVISNGVVVSAVWGDSMEDTQHAAEAYAEALIPDQYTEWKGEPWRCSDCGYVQCRCAEVLFTESEEDWYGEALMAQYDDDPNPYHGDYSEC